MSIHTEMLTVIGEAETQKQEDIIFVNEYEDRRYVFKKPDKTHPYVRQTAFQGMNRYGEWLELMEVTEERYPGQKPFYTIGIFIPVGQDQENTVLTKYTYGDPRSGWEEGFSRCAIGRLDETQEDLHEMSAVVTGLEELPELIDTEATANTLFQQIENNDFTTPPLFRIDYLPGKEGV